MFLSHDFLTLSKLRKPANDGQSERDVPKPTLKQLPEEYFLAPLSTRRTGGTCSRSDLGGLRAHLRELGQAPASAVSGNGWQGCRRLKSATLLQQDRPVT